MAFHLKKKLTRQTEERMDSDRPQSSFIGTYEEGNKREGGEGGGLKVGESAAEPTNGVKAHINSH